MRFGSCKNCDIYVEVSKVNMGLTEMMKVHSRVTGHTVQLGGYNKWIEFTINERVHVILKGEGDIMSTVIDIHGGAIEDPKMLEAS